VSSGFFFATIYLRMRRSIMRIIDVETRPLKNNADTPVHKPLYFLPAFGAGPKGRVAHSLNHIKNIAA
jgi:hypothetical protein